MGQRVGRVKEVRRDHIVVAGTSSFSNGDGLCYVAGAPGREELHGFRINRADGNHLFPHRMPQGLVAGMEVFRNEDRRMEAVLAGTTATRRLPLAWTLEETPQGFRLTASVLGHREGEVLRSASVECACGHQEARAAQEASIRDVLSRLGDTIYRAVRTDIVFSRPWFVPRSCLAQWRREVLEALAGAVENGGGTHAVLPVDGGMVSAGEAGEDTGVILQCGQDSACGGAAVRPLMVCRYCIRYQLGQCLRRNPQAVRGPLYLRGADGRRFLLRFDCRLCRMTVERDAG